MGWCPVVGWGGVGWGKVGFRGLLGPRDPHKLSKFVCKRWGGSQQPLWRCTFVIRDTSVTVPLTFRYTSIAFPLHPCYISFASPVQQPPGMPLVFGRQTGAQ